MKKALVGAVAAAALCIPVAAFADNGQIVALYQQLIQLLQQEIAILKNEALKVTPSSGKVPLEVSFMLGNAQGSEAIDFGDGHSSGSSGCTKNAAGYCDLAKGVSHTYQLPGKYTVTLYRTIGGTPTVITTTTVDAQK
jgi:hypothetical protein